MTRFYYTSEVFLTSRNIINKVTKNQCWKSQQHVLIKVFCIWQS